MKIGIFLEINNNCILPVGLELIGKTIDMMGSRDYSIHGIVAKSKNTNLLNSNLNNIEKYLDEVFIYEYEDEYLTTEHFTEALCDYIETENPSILLLGATPLGRSFGPRVAAYFKTGITADCTQIRYEEEYGLIQIRPAFGEEVLAEIITPKSFPQMATVRPGVMDAPSKSGEKQAKKTIHNKKLFGRKLKIIDRYDNKPEIELGKAKIVIVAGNAIRNKEELLLIHRLAKVLGGEYGVTRPLVEGGIASYSRQVGVSGTILKASIVLLLGVSGSNKTLAGIGKAKKIIAVNNDPNASVFKNVDIGIVEDWKAFTENILNKKERC
ncbi:MAG: electron transfer flavoprotein subunit alpha/FixB family protein [Tissierellia bacterium]|jgi:electron transfer flavoprotein alpha subunit|nr:electron transfer flavoprotein subunit alpha/FixB family protein [Tissierellia bacterium]